MKKIKVTSIQGFLKALIFFFLFNLIFSCNNCDNNGVDLINFLGKPLNNVSAPNPGSGMKFGDAVSISGDYAIVGAVGENEHKGAAYIFKRNGDTWDQHQRFGGSSRQGLFGLAVSISGDHAMVGASMENDTKGAAHIYKRTGDQWEEETVLLPNEPDTQYFGVSVSISGEYAIVGANSANNVGRAYVFKNNGSQWDFQEILAPHYPIPNSGFGGSVSIDGEYAIVGASTYESHGIVYIFERKEDGWRSVNAFNGETDSNFGASVSIDGIFAIVGAPLHNNENGTQAGTVFIYKRVMTEHGYRWEIDSTFIAEDGDDYDHFGIAVSMYARSESGGYAIIGADMDTNDSGEHAGAAYALITVEGKWTQYLTLLPPSGSERFHFGRGVSLQDGNAIVGARGCNDRSGCVYFYD